MAGKQSLTFWQGIAAGILIGALLTLLSIKPEPATAPQTESQTNAYRNPVIDPMVDEASAPHAVAEPENLLPEASPPTLTEPDQAAPLVGNDALLLAKPLPTTPALPIQSRDRQARHGPGQGRLALVLDDAGYDLQALKRILRLPVPFAISILPDAPHAAAAATLAKQAHHIVMLHLPMQPEDPSLQMDATFLHADMSREEMRQVFTDDLAMVPHVEGVNNHMGSRLTQMQQPMRWMMEIFREQGLFFVDSRTSANSIAAGMAEQFGLPWASRQVFIDHEMKIGPMKQAWKRARSCIQKGYDCVVIAHPRPMTVAFLENYLSQDDANHIVSIRQLLITGHTVATTEP